MKILVTGSDGYIGSVLVPTLLRAGHDVVGIDAGYYSDGRLYDDGSKFTSVRKDLRDIDADFIASVQPQAVIHLAELSNDPLGQHNPDLTYAINHGGSINLARLAKAAGVERFIYTSSCSVYGAAGEDGDKTEDSSVNPQTTYAECKILVERDLKPMADETFSPTFLRNATVFGESPNMRFDLVLNNLSGLAYTTNVIQMNGDGSAWRPIVHVAEVAEAILAVLAAPRDLIHNETFNVGGDADNYRVKQIAEIVGEAFAGTKIAFGSAGADNRSYRVSFAKIRDRLGFVPKRNALIGAQELYTRFNTIGLTPERFAFRNFTRLSQLQHLLDNNLVSPDLYWTQR